MQDKNRIGDELHIPNVGHRVTSAEPLSEHENVEESEFCFCAVEDKFREICCGFCCKLYKQLETDADSLSVSPSPASLFTKRTFFTAERKWRVIFANLCCGGIFQQRYPKWFREWCVMMIKKNNKLMQQFIGGTTRPMLVKAFANR